MPPKPIPRPSILDGFEFLGAPYGERRWRSHEGRRLYTWDSLHGEVEVFNSPGRHLGSLDPITGAMIARARNENTRLADVVRSALGGMSEGDVRAKQLGRWLRQQTETYAAK